MTMAFFVILSCFCFQFALMNATSVSPATDTGHVLHVQSHLDSTYELYMQKNSPFARMVRVLIAMTPELNDRIKIIAEDLTNKSQDLFIDNPNGKVPKLVCNGITVLDSKFILMYLSGVINRPEVALKNTLEDRVFETSRNLMELAKANFYERKKENCDFEIIAKNEELMSQNVVQLKVDIKQVNRQGVNIAKIAAICGLDYIKNRGQFDWTQMNDVEELSQWHAELSVLPAFKDTIPEVVIGK